jgi:hypothetical protein
MVTAFLQNNEISILHDRRKARFARPRRPAERHAANLWLTGWPQWVLGKPA